MSTDEGRYHALRELRGCRPRDSRVEWQMASVLLDRSTGCRFIRLQDMADYVRKGCRVTISRPELKPRLGEIGWKTDEMQMWPPGVPREEAERTNAKVRVNVL